MRKNVSVHIIHAIASHYVHFAHNVVKEFGHSDSDNDKQ